MTDDFTDDASQPAPTKRRKWRPAMLWLFTGFAVFAYAFDQLTKLWVTSTMTEGERIPVLPPLLHWYYIRNSGAAFSIGENVTWIFTIVMAAVSVSTQIAAPVAEVFALFTDLKNAPGRVKGIKRIELLTNGPVGVGTRFRETRVMFKRDATEECKPADPGPGHLGQSAQLERDRPELL